MPGPPIPLYFLGAQIVALVPLGPVFHGAGVNVTVMSNNGKVHVGVIACRESMPDVDNLARRFPTELAALKEDLDRLCPVLLALTRPTPVAGRAERLPPAV